MDLVLFPSSMFHKALQIIKSTIILGKSQCAMPCAPVCSKTQLDTTSLCQTYVLEHVLSAVPGCIEIRQDDPEQTIWHAKTGACQPRALCPKEGRGSCSQVTAQMPEGTSQERKTYITLHFLGKESIPPVGSFPVFSPLQIIPEIKTEQAKKAISIL